MHRVLLLAAVALWTWTPARPEVSPVSVVVYYETHCPSSASFLVEQLYPVHSRLSRYMSLELVPYGKARHRKYDHDRFEFSCHHGPDECDDNKMHACAIYYVSPEERLVRFVRCTLGPWNWDWRRCANRWGIDQGTLADCAHGRVGQSLLAAMGDKTASLRPPLTRVPTVVFEGRPDTKDQNMAVEDFQYILCVYIAWRQPRPQGCKRQYRGRSVELGDYLNTSSVNTVLPLLPITTLALVTHISV